MLTIKSTLDNLPISTKTIFIAYSGGMDSTVLLDLITKQADATLIKNIQVIHIHHGLSSNADQWVTHCIEQAELRKLPIQIIRVDAKAGKGESPEAAARRARYQAFNEILSPDDCLFMAHHQNDQVETFFLQLFRGAGIKGLSGIPIKKIKKFQLIRPLLNYSRKQLEEYAIENNLSWIDDESNFDTNYQRNYLRHEVLPSLKQKWPGMNAAVLRTQSLCQEANVLLNQLAEMDLRLCRTEHLNILNIDQLLILPIERRANLLRYWIALNQFQLPSQKKLQQIECSVLKSYPNANPLVTWDNTEIRRYRNKIYILKPLKSIDKNLILIWDINKELILPDSLEKIDKSIYQKYKIPLPADNVKVSIRFRQGGERLKLPNRASHHDLKKLLQEQGIPPWQRDRIPLLYHDEELVGVLINLNYFLL